MSFPKFKLALLTDFLSPFPYILIFLLWGGWLRLYDPGSRLFVLFSIIFWFTVGIGSLFWIVFVTLYWVEGHGDRNRAAQPSKARSAAWTPKAVHQALEENGRQTYIKIWNLLAQEFKDHQLVGTDIDLDIINWAHSEKKLLPTADLSVLAPRQPARLEWVSKVKVRKQGRRRAIYDDYMDFESGVRSVPDQELAGGEMVPEPRCVVFDLVYQGETIHLHFFQWIVDYGGTRVAWFAHFSDTSDQIGRELFAEVYRWQNVLKNEIWMYDEKFFKSKSLYAEVMSSDAEELVLPQETLHRLRADTQTFFESQSIFETLQVPWKRGILLMGPPGNGKTATIKAIIRDSIGKAAILYARRLKDCRDRTTPAITAVFKHARENAPCLLIFEDLDSLVEESARSVLLNELDGLHSNDGILIIASTNHAGKLDDALLNRPSRFDQKYHFDLPNEELRTRFIDKWLRERVGLSRLSYDGASNEGVDIKNADELIAVMAKLTAGWSFAFLKELFLSFLLKVAVRQGTPGIGNQSGTAEKSKPDSRELSAQLKNTDVPVTLLLEQLEQLSAQVKVPKAD
ncbi:hypothetical protein OC846_003977 [Tilletia horrida]|uniref:AAA+ ATPase domain-containing protein n=1 Tax=Tilletia horrida TaxID=155126 RepID=A0AAN6GR91_9BASI|nr:hypothetical protein OC845_003997 [Tilletia horrida]KAK0549671.1 hypothetical protein OC846_003977 [Tilletia horrida]KAK0564791.1 hypothetical protein OC861_004086 [Tilletia horrida]